MNPQYVYCIVNDELSNLCKCGGTANYPTYRCDQLSNTSLPVRCKLAYFIEVNNWRKAEKFVHGKISEMGIKRFEGREWFNCKPDDIKSVFDECKKLYGYNGENNKKEDTENTSNDKKEDTVNTSNDKKEDTENNSNDNKEDTVNRSNDKKKDIKNINYHCDPCDYETNERTAFYHHNKSKRHELCIRKIDISEYQKVIKENNELKQNLIKENDAIKQKIKKENDIIKQKIKKENINLKNKILFLEKDNMELKNKLLEKDIEILKLKYNDKS